MREIYWPMAIRNVIKNRRSTSRIRIKDFLSGGYDRSEESCHGDYVFERAGVRVGDNSAMICSSSAATARQPLLMTFAVSLLDPRHFI